jgi:outer membrane protein assembly factor BamE (lipoprotein component of BamABCDE complex)
MFKAWKPYYALLAILIVGSTLNGCSLYRSDLRQGNYIVADRIEELRPGQTKHQVQQIMGTVALTPVFEINQWNYNYAYVDGKHRDQPLKYKTLTLYFEHDTLQSYSSDTWTVPHLPKHK